MRPKSLKPDKKIRALTIEEQIKLSNYLKDHPHKHTNLFLLALNTGARVGELLALKTGDVHLSENYFNIERTTTIDLNGKNVLGNTTKTKSSKRLVILNDITKPIMQNALNARFKSDDNLIFCKQDGSVYSTTSINSAFKRLCKNAGIKSDVNFHMLRHSFITRSKEAGVSVEATKSTVGHDSTYVTMSIYNENQKDYLEKQSQLYVNYISNLKKLNN